MDAGTNQPKSAPYQIGGQIAITAEQISSITNGSFSATAQQNETYLARFGLASRREPKGTSCSPSAAALKRHRRILFNEHIAKNLGCSEIELVSDDEDEPEELV